MVGSTATVLALINQFTLRFVGALSTQGSALICAELADVGSKSVT